MYFYLSIICIQNVLCVFRLPTANVTLDMSFYLRRNKDWLINWLSGRRSKEWCSCRASCCFAQKGWIHLQHTCKAVTFNGMNLRATSTRIRIYFFQIGELFVHFSLPPTRDRHFLTPKTQVLTNGARSGDFEKRRADGRILRF